MVRVDSYETKSDNLPWINSYIRYKRMIKVDKCTRELLCKKVNNYGFYFISSISCIVGVKWNQSTWLNQIIDQ